MKYCYYKNGLTELASAAVSLNDIGLLRGYAIFDFFRVEEGIPLYWPQHKSRLLYGAETLHLMDALNNIDEAVRQVIEANTIKQGCIRVLVSGGDSEDGFTLKNPLLIITPHHKPTYNSDWYTKGIKALTHEHTRQLPAVKTTSYLVGVQLQQLLRNKMVDDVIYYNEHTVTETPRANVFAVMNGRLITPARDILSGITRSNVLSVAANFISAEERDITPEEFKTADEIFITSTTKGILPVTRLNDEPVGSGYPGLVTGKLSALLQSHEMTWLKQNTTVLR